MENISYIDSFNTANKDFDMNNFITKDIEQIIKAVPDNGNTPELIMQLSGIQ